MNKRMLIDPFVCARENYHRNWALRKRRSSGRLSEGKAKFVVLVHTFDGYRRFWGPCLFFLGQNVDPAIDICFASEREAPASPRVIHLPTGAGSFVRRLEVAVSKLAGTGASHVLYLQEDHWLLSALSSERLNGLAQYAQHHRLDALKLGKFSFTPDDLPSIRSNTDILPARLEDQRLHWFGGHSYPVSHHMTLFSVPFLLETLRAARWRGVSSASGHELFCGAYLAGQVKALTDDSRPYRIATWVDSPLIDYVHAASVGQLTDEGRAAIGMHGLDSLWQEAPAGDVFPEFRMTA